MKRKRPGSRQALVFLIIFLLGSLYYFICGDPCPFHHDPPGKSLPHQGGQAHFLCLCVWGAFQLPAASGDLGRIACLGLCPATRAPRLADLFVQDITHPPQLSTS